nr:MAG TPA: hypothetical protein [Caudoviricetes sp.]
MKFNLSKEDYLFLMRNSEKELSESIRDIEEKNENISFVVADAGNLLGLIGDAVFLYGMDDEYGATKIGKRLYSICDEILYQKRQQEEQP